jgi:cellulose synthase/poly-beta-1,6-N-acetylglucosamine synthase-like glycosyltransferase
MDGSSCHYDRLDDVWVVAISMQYDIFQETELTAMKDFLIIIPAYNEEKNIIKVLADLADLKRLVDIVVINDGSIDATEAMIQK